MKKMPCVYKPFLFLVMVSIIILFFSENINILFGGDKNCFICRKVNYNGYLTNWTISHIGAFTIAGYICPNNKFILITLGILWEILEVFLEYHSTVKNTTIKLCKIMPKCKNKKISSKHFWEHYFGINNNKIKLYWCSGGVIGGIMDIIADILGVYLGSYLATITR